MSGRSWAECRAVSRSDYARMPRASALAPDLGWVRAWLLPHFAGGFQAHERQLLFADGQIPAVEHLSRDVSSIAKFALNEIRFSVLQLVERGRFLRMRLNVCELAIGVDSGNVERTFGSLNAVGELEIGWILGAELAGFALDHGLCRLPGIAGFSLRDLHLLAIVFHLLGGHKPRLAVGRRKHRFILRLDENLEIGLGIGRVRYLR